MARATDEAISSPEALVVCRSAEFHNDEVCPMMKRKMGRTPPISRDVNGVALQYLISYLQDHEPAGTLQKVFREAGETRSPKTVQSAASWSSYAQFRRLLEATGSVLDGLTTLARVSDHVFDSHQSPELSDSMSSLGSPADTYAALPGLMDSTVPIVELLTESVSPTECRIRLRFKGDLQPFPEYCAYQINLLTTMPRVFGAPEAEVFVEACQCEGADYCQALLRWAADRRRRGAGVAGRNQDAAVRSPPAKGSSAPWPTSCPAMTCRPCWPGWWRPLPVPYRPSGTSSTSTSAHPGVA